MIPEIPNIYFGGSMQYDSLLMSETFLVYYFTPIMVTGLWHSKGKHLRILWIVLGINFNMEMFWLVSWQIFVPEAHSKIIIDTWWSYNWLIDTGPGVPPVVGCHIATIV